MAGKGVGVHSPNAVLAALTGGGAEGGETVVMTVGDAIGIETAVVDTGTLVTSTELQDVAARTRTEINASSIAGLLIWCFVG